jgi:hypothetical protein
MKDIQAKNYNAVLLEAAEFFKAQGISIIGEGFKEIATNPALFESYVEALTEGTSADSAAVISQLMVNTNAGILRESSLSGIAPIASLSMPVIRKLWPKYAIKEAFKTEVAKTPRFVVSYTKPYLFRGAEEKVFLPKGLIENDANGGLTALGKKDFSIATIASLGTGASKSVDFGTASQDSGNITVAGHALVSGSALSGSATKRQPLDSQLRVTNVHLILVSDDAGTDEYVLTVPSHKIDVTGSIFLEFSQTLPLGLASVTAGRTLAAATVVSGQLIVRADLQKGTALVASLLGYTAKIIISAGVSTEFNETSYSLGFDIGRYDIDIPTGQHINAPLPIEALNDMMALYQIDGTKETVDLMTNVFATKLDLEALEFLQNSYLNQPGVAEFQGYPSASDYTVVFDVRPAAGFAGSPKAWREELKPQIDWLSQRIKNATYLQSGIFTLIGNPLDIQLLTNVDWQFRGGQGVNMDGVDVDYSLGTYVGANAYKVLASVNVPQGVIYLVFTPSSDTQMTYKYFPYTFSTEMGYIDPNRSRVPSIMMTKRHTFAEFLPAIGAIRIDNNNTGYGQFNTLYSAGAGTWGNGNNN